MGKLIYGIMAVSLDGFVNDADGSLEWSDPDEEVQRFVTDRLRGIGTYLFGRRLSEAMRIWDDDEALAGLPPSASDYAPVWRGADKVVFSTTLEEPALPRTRLERRLDVDAVRAWKESSAADLEVGGPTLAGSMLKAGLVDEIHLLLVPAIVGGGTRFLPDDLRLDLTLAEERRFPTGTVFLRYEVGRHSTSTSTT